MRCISREAPFGAPTLIDQIDVAPVDAEIERRRADHRAQFARRHRVFDLAALRDVERAVMQRDGEIVVVDAPQLLEQELGLAARVDEDQRGLVPLDQIVDLAERVARRMARPGQMFLRVEHGDQRLRAGLRHDDIGARRPRRRLRHQKAGEIVGLGHRRRQADGRELRRQREQPRQAERQQIAALGRHQRMQFVEHHAAQRAEQIRRVGRGEQQRELLRRGEQDVGRIAALALALGGGRVAGAGFQLHGKPHLAHRNFQVARDVDRQRLQRRDVERVQALRTADRTPGRNEPARRRCRFIQLHQRRQEAGQRLAAAGRRDQQRRAPCPGLGQQFELMRARRPAAAGKPAREQVRQKRRGIAAVEGGCGFHYASSKAYLKAVRNNVLGSNHDRRPDGPRRKTDEQRHDS